MLWRRPTTIRFCPWRHIHDKYTQVLWGIADFEYHFGHKPAGMWLPETAVNNETLEVLAECGIEYIILAPWQADVKDLDNSHPYRVDLPAGKRMAVFFYNQDLSTRISFDPGATINADDFLLEMLLPKFRSVKSINDEPQLIMIASDGELYGHHQPFRDKFLGYLLDGALSGQPIKASLPGFVAQRTPSSTILQLSVKILPGAVLMVLLAGKGFAVVHPIVVGRRPYGLPLMSWPEHWMANIWAVIQPLLQDAWQLRHQYIHVLHGQVGSIRSGWLFDREKIRTRRAEKN